MRIWALIAQKGGAGKSTLATQLAAYACQCGEKAVIIDLDPQGSASVWHEVRGGGESPFVVKCLPEKLGKTIAAIRDSGIFSLVIIDTPPHTDKAAVAAIRETDLVICPTKPGLFDEAAISTTASLLELSEALPRAVGVINECGNAKIYGEASKKLERHNMRVAARYVRRLQDFVVAISKGKGVTETAPKGKSQASDDIIALWSELNETWPVVVATPKKAKA